MKTLMVDMDHVITNGRYFDYICEFLGENLELEKQQTYYLQDLVSHQKEEFWEWVKEKNFYEKAPLYQDCYSVLEKLNQKYELYIVTAYLWTDVIDLSGENLKNKYYYLRKMLPFIKPKQYIFTTNKKMIPFDIKVDDRVDNLEQASTKILFSAWHNKKLTEKELKEKGIIRVNDWKEIEELLLNEK